MDEKEADAAPAAEIFLATAPGLEAALYDEVVERGFLTPKLVKGGVTAAGGMQEAWRANLEVRGATHVLMRIASFRAMHLAQLDKRARKVPWGDFLRAEVPVRVEASCHKSKIYHAGAAAQRIATAIADELGAPIADSAEVRVLARIEDDLCTVSIDTSGEPLHKRGHKEAVAKAPMRETMAALFLRQCGYRGDEPVLDPMCGSGTFVIEAAEMALGLRPGRTRRFAFEQMAGFDVEAWRAMRASGPVVDRGFRFHGSDRDVGAVAMSRENAKRAGVGSITEFREAEIGDITPPEGPPGLVMVNPPYGLRIGERSTLRPLYMGLGDSLRRRFGGWRVGIITAVDDLARATGLRFLPPGEPVLHGGIRVKLWRTAPLP